MMCEPFTCPTLNCAVDELEATEDDECCPKCLSGWVEVSFIVRNHRILQICTFWSVLTSHEIVFNIKLSLWVLTVFILHVCWECTWMLYTYIEMEKKCILLYIINISSEIRRIKLQQNPDLLWVLGEENMPYYPNISVLSTVYVILAWTSRHSTIISKDMAQITFISSRTILNILPCIWMSNLQP